MKKRRGLRYDSNGNICVSNDVGPNTISYLLYFNIESAHNSQICFQSRRRFYIRLY